MNAQTKIDAPTGLALLRAPFPDHQISKLPKPNKAQTEAVQKDYKAGIRCELCGAWHHPKVQHLDYVGHAALTDRLLDVDPNWTWEPVAFGADGLPAFDQSGGLWIRLTVCNHTRLGYGHGERKPLDKTGGDRIKEVIGDALRNAAMRFGAALDLWHKGDLHLEPDGEPAGGHSEGREDSPRQDTLSAEQLTKLRMLIKAVGTNEIAVLKAAGAPDGALIRDMPLAAYTDVIERLEAKLAKMAKDESNAKATDWNKGLDDEIPSF